MYWPLSAHMAENWNAAAYETQNDVCFMHLGGSYVYGHR